MRKFKTGATRNDDSGRIDPEGFLSPIVVNRYCEYMNSHRKQSDGSIRDSDNWQKGIDQSVYMKGMWRHFLHLWTRHRGYSVSDPLAAKNMEDDLCALMFNVQGMLFEILKRDEVEPMPSAIGTPIAERFPDYKAWFGGECPVNIYQMVEVCLRNGERTQSISGYLDWMHTGISTDIIGYRICSIL